MAEHPILFSGPMVRAILDGKKTQTRRVMKSQPYAEWTPKSYGDVHKMKDGEFVLVNGEPVVVGWGVSNADGDAAYVCPYGQPGDRLWVRETFCYEDKETIYYKATWTTYDGDGGWKPSIHMPRWASRITLEIVNVRVERLQEISEEDAKAEGVFPSGDNAGPHIKSFFSLWQAINSARGYSWDSNPWVWVVEFKRV